MRDSGDACFWRSMLMVSGAIFAANKPPAPLTADWFLLVASKGTRRRQGIWGDVDVEFAFPLILPLPRRRQKTKWIKGNDGSRSGRARGEARRRGGGGALPIALRARAGRGHVLGARRRGLDSSPPSVTRFSSVSAAFLNVRTAFPYDPQRQFRIDLHNHLRFDFAMAGQVEPRHRAPGVPPR